MSILLVHDDVDYGINTGTEIEHQVAEDVDAWPVDVLVGHLDDGDGKVAGQERQENRQNHLRDAPLISLLLSIRLVGRC